MKQTNNNLWQLGLANICSLIKCKSTRSNKRNQRRTHYRVVNSNPGTNYLIKFGAAITVATKLLLIYSFALE